MSEGQNSVTPYHSRLPSTVAGDEKGREKEEKGQERQRPTSWQFLSGSSGDLKEQVEENGETENTNQKKEGGAEGEEEEEEEVAPEGAFEGRGRPDTKGR